jgi:quinol monooxygenase YgiN
MRPGQEERLDTVFEQLAIAEAHNEGVLRLVGMRDQDDPTKAHVLITFVSEEKARAAEQDPDTAVVMKSVRALMAEVFVGPPTFLNLTVLRDATLSD